MNVTRAKTPFREVNLFVSTFGLKRKLQSSIIEQIKKRVKCRDDHDFANGILSGLDYSSPKPLLRGIFVLFNIEYLNQKIRCLTDQQKKRNDHERFPFDLYSNIAWNIEHIDSYTTNPMTNPQEQVEWAIEMFFEYNRNNDNAHLILGWLRKVYNDKSNRRYKDLIDDFLKHFDKKDILDLEGSKIDPNTIIDFPELYKTINESINTNMLEETRKNHLSNLTLLDENTNKGYHNAIFPVKRRKIVELDQSNIDSKSLSVFVPPCTRNVFTKYYTSYASLITQWTNNDANDYQKALQMCFNQLFSLAKQEDILS